MVALDNYLFFALYNLSGKSDIIDTLIVFVGEYYLFVLLFVLGVVAWNAYRVKGFHGVFPYAIALLAGVIARYGVSDLIRFAYQIPRPFLEFSLSEPLLTVPSYSFPSGHTIFIFAVGAAAYFFNKKLAYFFFVSGVLVGIARIIGGVHYPSDILGGIVLGSITGAFIYLVWLRYVLGSASEK